MNESTRKKNNIIIWIVLHIMLALYSLGSVCSKIAANEEFLSFRFCLFYGLLLLILGVYAIGWQQIIKRMPLTAAYANKAISIVWACIYGVIFFDEKLTVGKIVGGAIVAAGVILFALSDNECNPETASDGGATSIAGDVTNAAPVGCEASIITDEAEHDNDKEVR